MNGKNSIFQIIYDWHSARPSSSQPESDWNDPDHNICKILDNVPLCSVSVSRSIAGYPLISMMTLEQLNEVEKLLRNVFKNAALSIDGEELTGCFTTFYLFYREYARNKQNTTILLQI